MKPETAQALKEHTQAIAKILYEETSSEKLPDLENLEKTVRELLIEHVTPEIGIFLSTKPQVLHQEGQDNSKAVWEN